MYYIWNMNKKVIIGLIVSLVLFLGLGFLISSNQKVPTLPSKDQIVFYYGNTCPHCKETEEWMAANKVEDKVTIMKKEVYDNRDNSMELGVVAKSCGMDTGNIGVPFLYAEGKCYTGTPDVENYLSNKAGLTTNENK